MLPEDHKWMAQALKLAEDAAQPGAVGVHVCNEGWGVGGDFFLDTEDVLK
jgi:hypothetical protein